MEDVPHIWPAVGLQNGSTVRHSWRSLDQRRHTQFIDLSGSETAQQGQSEGDLERERATVPATFGNSLSGTEMKEMPGLGHTALSLCLPLLLPQNVINLCNYAMTMRAEHTHVHKGALIIATALYF